MHLRELLETMERANMNNIDELTDNELRRLYRRASILVTLIEHGQRLEVCDYLTAEEFLNFNLDGRPVLAEQGQAVTRAIIDRYECDAERWNLHLRNLEYLNKATGKWELEEEQSVWSGRSKMDSFARYFKDAKKTIETRLHISSYGNSIHIGPHCDRPWEEVHWPDELDTSAFRGGIMEPPDK